MVLVNTLGSKITTLGSVRASVGVFFMPLLFVITDIITEVYGKKTSTQFVNLSTIMMIFMFLMIGLCIILPPNETWGLQSAKTRVFGTSMRMPIASLTSFYIAQHIDALIFAFKNKITKEKHLWIRNNESTIISQFVDTTIFMFLTFYKMNPDYTFSFLWTLILPYWGFKVIFALLDTPICYLGVWWLKRSE